MTSEKAFQIYFALKLHFTSKYDVFERGINFTGKNCVNQRKDFGLIFPIMKHVEREREMIEFCVANHLYGNPNFLYDEHWALENYKHWLKVKQSLTYKLEMDLCTIDFYNGTLKDYLSNQVISDLLSRKIEYESLILLNNKYPVIDYIQGFDCLKYKVRMHKASRFVNKGILGSSHISRIDNFLATKEKEISYGNDIITTA